MLLIRSKTDRPGIAWFISGHGFGHASRAAAVMCALERIIPRVRFELFTDCPQWIFRDSLTSGFNYHEVCVDVGMVQRSPLEEDLEATCRRLDRWLPFDHGRILQWVERLRQTRCRLAICDISPFGVAVAKEAGVPCVLIENFTWDWIYSAYVAKAPRLEKHISLLSRLYADVDLHIQAAPLCRPVDGALRVPPIGRLPRTPPGQIRARLNIPEQGRMVLVSMGGVPDRFRFLDRLKTNELPYIVVPGANDRTAPHPKVLLLPTHSSFFHPDLLQAADLLVGKAGYSTLAEAYLTGTPFGYVARAQSPESPSLEAFIREHLSSHPISAPAYRDGRWLEMLPRLLQLPRSRPPQANGAAVVAQLLCERFFPMET